jgi:hypothetical protein
MKGQLLLGLVPEWKETAEAKSAGCRSRGEEFEERFYFEFGKTLYCSGGGIMYRGREATNVK